MTNSFYYRSLWSYQFFQTLTKKINVFAVNSVLQFNSMISDSICLRYLRDSISRYIRSGYAIRKNEWARIFFVLLNGKHVVAFGCLYIMQQYIDLFLDNATTYRIPKYFTYNLHVQRSLLKLNCIYIVPNRIETA